MNQTAHYEEGDALLFLSAIKLIDYRHILPICVDST